MSDVIKNNKGPVINRSNININVNQAETAGKAAMAVIKLKQLVAEDKVGDCLNKLESFFEKKGNKEALNTVSYFSGKLKEIQKHFFQDKISNEVFALEKAKIVNGVLALIDNEIKP